MAGVLDKVKGLIKTGKVVVFSKTYCPYCDDAKQIFSSAGVTFDTYELDKLPEGQAMQNALLEITGQKTVPNIFIAEKHIGGCSDLQAKIANGQVITILEQAGIPFTL